MWHKTLWNDLPNRASFKEGSFIIDSHLVTQEAASQKIFAAIILEVIKL